MNKVLIGSSAMRIHFPDFNREPKDKDFAVLEKENDGNDNLIIPLVVEYSDSEVASPELLLTLKLSHIFWDELGERNWDKHMWDIVFLINHGIDYDKELFNKLVEFWKEHYKKFNRSNLTLNKEEFFDNQINNTIDHDAIHEIIHPSPIYKELLKEGCDVEPDPNNFHNLSEKDKDRVIQEEVMVMAWERWPELNYKRAYYRMYKKFLKSHIPMFALDHMVKNYVRLSTPPFNYIEKINNQLLKMQ